MAERFFYELAPYAAVFMACGLVGGFLGAILNVMFGGPES